MDRPWGILFTSDSVTLSQAVSHVAYTWKSTVRRNEHYHYEEDPVQQKATGKAQVKSNEKRPYNVPMNQKQEGLIKSLKRSIQQ